MFRPALPLVLVAALMTSACNFGSPVGATLTQSRIGTDVFNGSRTALAVRLLAQGTFTLPASLISVGSGSLVSVGSGGLVSVGTGGLVSVGTGHYRVQSVAEQPVGNAPVALANAAGATGVATTTDAAGRFFLTGSLTGGVYRLEAGHGDARYLSLVAVGADAPADSTINLATTLVATRLLAAHPDGNLPVLDVEAFAAMVAAVGAAVNDQDLPEGWTPARASETLAALEAKHPEVKAAVDAGQAQQNRLEHRASDIQYRVQTLAEELKLPPAQVSGALMAALSTHPTASDDELAHQVRATSPGASGGSGGGSAPTGSAPVQSTAPAPAATNQSATSPAPSPSGSTAPATAKTPTPTASTAAGKSPAPTASTGTASPSPSATTSPSGTTATSTGSTTSTGNSSTTASSGATNSSGSGSTSTTTSSTPTPTATSGNTSNGAGNSGNTANNSNSGNNGNASSNSNSSSNGNNGNSGNNANANSNGNASSNANANGSSNGNGSVASATGAGSSSAQSTPTPAPTPAPADTDKDKDKDKSNNGNHNGQNKDD